LSTFVFNKVVRWQESGEVDNAYVAYNFGYLSLLKLIEVWRSSGRNSLCSSFLRRGVV